MASKNKTEYSEQNVTEFINGYVEKEAKKQDSFKLAELMQKWSGHEPRMWGPTIIGFGTYHYKYASGHEGDAPIIGFSPRRAEFSLYVTFPGEDYGDLLQKLGNYKMGKACIYFKKLNDLNLDVLEEICKKTISFLPKTA